MKARIDAGSDIAMIGAWDAQRGSTPLTPTELKHSLKALESDAADGHLFLVRMGGDGGGPIDLYVNEAIPGQIRSQLVPAGGELLLVLPSGTLVVDGAEYYRAPTRQATRRHASVSVPPGDYSVRCYTPKDDAQPPKSEEALKELVGSAELEYYDRANRTGCLVGALTLLLFPVLLFALDWRLALLITVVVFLAFFHAREWLLKRNARYRRLNNVVPEFRLANQSALLVLELRSIPERGRLSGGSVSL